MKNHKKMALSGAMLFAAGVCNMAHAAGQYTITALSAPLITRSQATNINASGQVVAWGFGADGQQVQAYRFDSQTTTHLGSFFVEDINDAGDAVGSTGGPVSHAVVYQQGQLTNIGNLVDRGGTSYASSINNAGQVVGSGFLYQAGNVTWLSNPSTGGLLAAAAISNTGYITGGMAGSSAGVMQQAFVYKDGAVLGLGTLGGAYARGHAVNDAGQVAGDSMISGSEGHAFLYANNQLLDIHPAGGWSSSAQGVNSLGQAVGTFSLKYSGGPFADEYRGFLYSNGVSVDLNSLIDPASGWRVDDAVAINDAGQIAAIGCHASGCTALLLTPVPEPATLLYLASGLGPVGAREAPAPSLGIVSRPCPS